MHLCERFGTPAALSVWKTTFADREDVFLNHILSTEWKPANPEQDCQPEKKLNRLFAEYFLI